MEVITKYKAFDGVEFLEESKCLEHESNVNEASKIVADLPSRPDGCDFSNGEGFIQHRAAPLLQVRNRFLEFCKRFTDHKWIQQSIDKGFDADPSWAGRIIGEVAPHSISKQWYRFQCIDSQMREWGQPYFAMNPDRAEMHCLNPE